MPRRKDKSYIESFEDPYTKIEDDETFHIGQSYEDMAATTIACAYCGGRTFNVGVGSCFTAIRCPSCEWEACIHEG